MIQHMTTNVDHVAKCQKDVKLSKRCQMSKSQTHGLWRRFTKKKIDIMRFTHIDVNFDISYDGYKKPQNVHKKCFWTILVTFIFDIKIDVNMCEPHYVNLFIFFVNLLHSLCVWLFDIWHLFDNLTSFWHFDIFLTISSQPVTGLFFFPYGR